ncbi:MAG TPA: serine/threonine-protein kinase [Gemmatimonadaceae bacterium]|nr:serine/threonine-protein kinase [Gemmatimonadaceae bacterium]
MPESGFTSSSSDAELRAHVERSLASSYELDREIGRGGMGIVYLARDRRLKRHVAIKLLPPELAFRSEIRTRFLREAETAAQLSHPNIVPIYSVDERDGLVYFVMAYVDGDTVASRLHARGPMAPDEVRHILIQTAEALAYAHERGVVHRDIKPDNILIDREDDRVMVTDFGIARAVTEGGDSRLTATGMAIGTPAYMSPEQSMGEREIDGRSDLYSLGIVAYQMLAGELPFTAQSTPALLVKHISERPPSIDERCPDAPRDLARAIMLLLEKEPANRFPSAEAFATALRTRNVPALPESAVYAERRPAERYPQDYPQDTLRSGASTAMDREPTPAELRRWNAEPVVKYRKKLAPYVAFSSVSVVLAIFDVVSFMPVVGVWSVYLAYKYSQLWTEGYDWRDVLREPRDRMFFDVVADWFDNVRALYDRKKRAELRERTRARRGRPPLFAAPDAPGSTGTREASSARRLATGATRGGDSTVVARAAHYRDDIAQIVHRLPRRERELASDVPASADALYQRVQLLNDSLNDIARNTPNESPAAIDAEIARLEAEANPLDPRSEQRVTRLARLRRDRRSVADAGKRREQTRQKLESCVLALENMRLDLIRLQTGGESFATVTLISERAMALAREVDNAVYAADEIRKLRDSTSGAGGARR